MPDGRKNVLGRGGSKDLVRDYCWEVYRGDASLGTQYELSK